MSTAHGSQNIKRVADSAIENYRIELFAENISPDGIIYGTRLLELVSKVAYGVAYNHLEKPCYTMGIDFIRYYSWAKRGDILLCLAAINRVWDTSMEIGIKLLGEDFRLLQEKRVLSAYFTFQAIDDKNEPVKIPGIELEGKVQRRRFLEAEKRKRILLKRKV